MSAMMSFSGKVIGIDHIDSIVEDSTKNVNKSNPELLTAGFIEFHVADGRHGFHRYAPYKAIHVGAASEEVSEALVAQLDNEGRMVIPVGPHDGIQHINIIDKDKLGRTSIRQVLPVSYVPLCDKSKQWPRSI